VLPRVIPPFDTLKGTAIDVMHPFCLGDIRWVV
jgi:hypothetical protein